MHATKTYPKQEIRDHAAKAHGIYFAWVDADMEGAIDPALFEHIHAAVSLFDPAEQPNAAQPVSRLSNVAAEFQARAEDFEAGGIPKLWPPSGFADDLDITKKALHAEPPSLNPLPTVQELIEQNVHPRQIAAIWKLRDKNGHPNESAVLQERDNPGSVVTPEHIEGVNQFRLAQLGFGPMAEYEFTPHERYRTPYVPKSEQLPPEIINPPSMEKMIRDGATIEQIANAMTRIDGRTADAWVPEVQAKAKEMGIRLPLNAQQVRNGAAAAQLEAGARFIESLTRGNYGSGGFGMGDERERAAKESAFFARPGQHVTKPVEPEIAPEIIEQVAALVGEGHDHEAITRHLGVPHQVVEDAIKAIEQEDQATEEAEEVAG